MQWQKPGDRSEHGHVNKSENSNEERKSFRASGGVPRRRTSIPVLPKGSEPVCRVRYVSESLAFVVFTFSLHAYLSFLSIV